MFRGLEIIIDQLFGTPCTVVLLCDVSISCLYGTNGFNSCTKSYVQDCCWNIKSTFMNEYKQDCCVKFSMQMKRLKVNQLNLTMQIDCQCIIIKNIAMEMYEALTLLTALKIRFSPPCWFGLGYNIEFYIVSQVWYSYALSLLHFLAHW